MSNSFGCDVRTKRKGGRRNKRFFPTDNISEPKLVLVHLGERIRQKKLHISTGIKAGSLYVTRVLVPPSNAAFMLFPNTATIRSVRFFLV